MFLGLGCSPIKVVCELGLERRETVRSIFGVDFFRIFFHNGTKQLSHWTRYMNHFKYKKLSGKIGPSGDKKKRIELKLIVRKSIHFLCIDPIYIYIYIYI